MKREEKAGDVTRCSEKENRWRRLISGEEERNTQEAGWRERRKGREEKWYKRRVKEKAPGIVPIHDVNAESVLKNGENNGATPPGSDSPFPRRFERRAFLLPACDIARALRGKCKFLVGRAS